MMLLDLAAKAASLEENFILLDSAPVGASLEENRRSFSTRPVPIALRALVQGSLEENVIIPPAYTRTRSSG